MVRRTVRRRGGDRGTDGAGRPGVERDGGNRHGELETIVDLIEAGVGDFKGEFPNWESLTTN